MAITNFARLAQSTHDKFIRGFEDETTQSKILLFGLRQRGKIKYNVTGDVFSWRVRKQRHPVDAYDDLDVITYDRRNLWTTASLQRAAYNVANAITKGEFLANRGMEAIFNVYQSMADVMAQDFEHDFNVNLYSGSGAGAELVGIDNIFRITATDNAVENPPNDSDTYAGIALDSSLADSTSDFWSPQTINAGFSGSDWDTALRPIETMTKIIRRCQIASGKSDMRGRPDVAIMDGDSYDQWQLDVQKLGQVFIRPGQTKLRAVEFGFDATPFKGVDITWDDSAPTTDLDSNTIKARILNFDFIELLSQQPTLFVGGVHLERSRKSYRFDMDFFGQLRARAVRHHGGVWQD